MAVDFPNLFAETDLTIPGMNARFQRLPASPPTHLISNVNVVPFIGNDCLVIVLSENHIDIPGGTLEAGETYLDAAKRELIEEAGAQLLDFNLFGGWHCRSSSPQPYRPHLPHPEFYRLTGYGNVRQIGLPANPLDGEQIIRVDRLSLRDAVQCFQTQGRDDLAELYQLAAYLRAENR